MAERRPFTIVLGEITAGLGIVAVIVAFTNYISDVGAKSSNASADVIEVKRDVARLKEDVAYTRGRVDAIADKVGADKPEK